MVSTRCGDILLLFQILYTIEIVLIGSHHTTAKAGLAIPTFGKGDVIFVALPDVARQLDKVSTRRGIVALYELRTAGGVAWEAAATLARVPARKSPRAGFAAHLPGRFRLAFHHYAMLALRYHFLNLNHF